MKKTKLPLQSAKLESESAQHLASHRSYMSNATKITPKQISVGDVIQFMYDGEQRTVYVMNPDWAMKLHGLSMKAIDRRTLMVEVVAKSDLYKSPQDFYTRVLSQGPVSKTDSYRTYDLRKMGNIMKVEYQIDERGREEL